MRMLIYGVALFVGACGVEPAATSNRPVVPLYVDVSPRDGQEAVEQPILSEEEVATIFQESESLALASLEQEEDIDGIEAPRPEDLEVCSQLTGMSPDRIVIAGAETRLSLDRETVLALRVVDSRTRVNLNLSQVTKEGLGGLCLFVAGKQPHADVRVGASIDLLVVQATGAQARVDLTMARGAVIRDWAVRLSGMGAVVNVAPPSTCPRAGISGANGSLVCR